MAVAARRLRRAALCCLLGAGAAAANGSGAAAEAPAQLASQPAAGLAAASPGDVLASMPQTGTMPQPGMMPQQPGGTMAQVVPGGIPVASPKQINSMLGLSDRTKDIVHGIVQSFLHKNSLEKGELECITTGAGQMAGNFMLLSSHSVLLMQQILGIKSTSDWIPLSVGYAGDGSPSLEDIMKAKKDKAAGDELSMYYGGGQGDQDAAAAVDTASEDSGQPTTTEGDLEEMEAVDTASEDAGQPTTSEGQPEGYGYDGPALNTSRRLDGQISKIVDDAFAKVTKDAPPIDAPVVIDAPQASAAGVQAPAAAAGGQAPAAAGQLPAMGGMMPAMGAGGAAVGAAGSATMPGMAGGMMPGMGGMPGMPGMGVGGDPFGGTSGVAALAMQGSAVLMELGVSIQQVVKLSHDILKICVKDDVKSAFKLASDHMHNLSYMGGHIMANGADILNQLADGVIAFQGHQYTEFGNHVGEAMRKIALSNNTNRTLPEGQAGQLVLSNLSAGLIDGFFGEGFLLDVSMPRGSAMHVDLHECMANNLVFFQSLWSDAMFWFAKKSQEHKDVLREANVSEGDETADEVLEGQHHKEKAEFGTAMALTMMQMPSALRRCNISKEQEEAFVDAMKTFGDGLNMRLTMPGEAGIKSQAADNLAQAVKDWTDMKWYSFGNDLGKVFQEMVTVMFPSKYSVDAAGGLRRMLQESGVRAPLLASVPVAAAAAGLLAAVALASAGAAAAVRRRPGARRAQGYRSWASTGPSVQDIEASSTGGGTSCE